MVLDGALCDGLGGDGSSGNNSSAAIDGNCGSLGRRGCRVPPVILDSQKRQFS